MAYLEWKTLALNPQAIYRTMGMTRGEKRSEVVLPTIERLRPTAARLIAARSISTVVAIEVTGKRQITLAEQLPFTCNSKYFTGATHAAVLIATVGSNLEQEADRCLRTGKYLEGLIYDACGSAALDEVLGLARQALSVKATSNGQRLGYTLSPGCQMIPLEEQATIFSLLDFEQVGVGLTDSYMMLPIKSVSAIIPLGEDITMPNDANYACEICSQQKNCQYRTNR